MQRASSETAYKPSLVECSLIDKYIQNDVVLASENSWETNMICIIILDQCIMSLSDHVLIYSWVLLINNKWKIPNYSWLNFVALTNAKL